MSAQRPPVSGLEDFRSAAILAGGRSERMGGLDKQMMEVGGERLILAQIRRLGSVFPDIVVVTARPWLYDAVTMPPGATLRTVSDSAPGFGPLSGLHAALRAAHSRWLFLMACDMPGFDPGLAATMRRMIGEREEAGQEPRICAATFGPHFEPFHAFYARELLEPIGACLAAFPDSETGAGLQHGRRMEGDGTRRPSIGSLVRSVRHILVPEAGVRAFTPDWSLFCNINTREELAVYEGTLADRISPQSGCTEQGRVLSQEGAWTP